VHVRLVLREGLPAVSAARRGDRAQRPGTPLCPGRRDRLPQAGRVERLPLAAVPPGVALLLRLRSPLARGPRPRDQPLVRRKRALRRVIPSSAGSWRLRCVDSVRGCGSGLYELACGHDAEGIVAKWASGRYLSDGTTTSWLKLKNPDYTQAVGRHELSPVRAPAGAAHASRICSSRRSPSEGPQRRSLPPPARLIR